jgi:hypothetical protein
MLACYHGQVETAKYLENKNINIYGITNNGLNAYQIAAQIFSSKQYRHEVIAYLENKFLYKSYSKICSICYEIKDDKFITCKNNHIVHLKCQQLINRNRCLMCSAKYVI